MGCSDDQNRGAASDSFSVSAVAAALPPDAGGLRLAPKRCPRPAASPAPSRGGGVLELAAPDIHSATLQPLARADSYRGAQCSILYLQSRGYTSYTRALHTQLEEILNAYLYVISTIVNV